jgi:hypothetical protein
MRVQAEFGGKYYAADVITVSTAKAKAKAPVKVAFVGYDGMDEWLGADRLRSKALTVKAAAKPEPKKAAAKAAPSAVDYSGLAKGMKVQAEFQGTFCAAEVVTVSTAKAKAKAPVKVSFIGYDASFDEWLGADRLKSKAIEKAPAQAKAAPKEAAAKAGAKAVDYSGLTKGMRIQAEYEGTFYAADVVTVSTAKAKAKAPVKVSFIGHNVEEWLGADRIKSKNLMVKAEAKKAPEKPASKAKAALEKASPFDYSGLAKGLRVQAESGGTYYAAEVLTVAKAKANPVKVKFIGYDGLDEWINGDRIRSKMLTKAAEPAKPKGAAKKAAATKKAEGTSKVYDYSGLEKGMRVQAETGGTFYAAEVLTVSTAKAKAKAPVKVHFVGYTADSDVWVGGDKLRSKALKTSKA